MKICIQVKSAGKRKPVLGKVAYEVSDKTYTTKTFIKEIVHIEVEKYNQKGTDVQIIPFLTNEELDAQAEVGKIGFGRIYSEKKVNLNKAIENAIQCYEDGIVRIFQNEDELEDLDAELVVNENDTFTFVRLVFLAGRMW